MSATWHPPPPSAIGTLPAAALEPILSRLLECPPSLTPTLASQCATAISELDAESRPDGFEGLLDVARYCVEDDPGWSTEDRKKLVGGHPRIGAPVKPGQMSEESRREQIKGGDADEATLKRLARLNDLYEKRFPGISFVTYVAGRPRAAISDELEQLLGKEVIDSKVDPNTFPSNLIVKEESKEWQEEFARGTDALWQIANDRASKMEAKSSEPAPSSTSSTADSATVQPPPSVGDEKKEEPFISLATFRMLALSSPVLESFFEKDLGASFQLAPADRSESGGAFSWHSAPALPNSPRSIPGADRATQSAGIANASYSKDVTTGTRGKVIGFLGGLMGEEGKAKMNALADTVGQRLQTHTISGPVPSFGRARTLDGTNMDTAELREKEEERQRTAAEERKASLGARLAGIVRKSSAVVPPLAPSGEGGAYSQVPGSASLQNAGMLPPDTPSRPDDDAEEDERGRSSSRDAVRQAKRASMRATDISSAGPNAAVEALRQAATLERSHFTIDEVGAGNGVGIEDEEEGEEELSIAQEGAETSSGGAKEGGRLEGKEAQLAKDLRSAPVQQ